MNLGRIIGTVVATQRYPGLDGVKLLVVQPLDKRRRDAGKPVVAADAVAMAGRGDVVYFVAAREAAQALPETFVPVDHAVVGIVDAVSLDGEPEGVRR
jgi:ethanolamine utilization protein EutN